MKMMKTGGLLENSGTIAPNKTLQITIARHFVRAMQQLYFLSKQLLVNLPRLKEDLYYYSLSRYKRRKT